MVHHISGKGRSQPQAYEHKGGVAVRLRVLQRSTRLWSVSKTWHTWFCSGPTKSVFQNKMLQKPYMFLYLTCYSVSSKCLQNTRVNFESVTPLFMWSFFEILLVDANCLRHFRQSPKRRNYRPKPTKGPRLFRKMFSPEQWQGCSGALLFTVHNEVKKWFHKFTRQIIFSSTQSYYNDDRECCDMVNYVTLIFQFNMKLSDNLKTFMCEMVQWVGYRP